MKLLSLFLLLFVVGMSACCKHKQSAGLSGDYMIVGYTGGLAGDIALQDYYLISYGKLKKATLGTEHVPSDVNKFNFDIIMPAAKYDLVKDLINAIPAELFSGPVSIGQGWPDAGYRDVRVSVKGKTYVWHFEADQSGSSPAIRQFLSRLEVLYQ